MRRRSPPQRSVGRHSYSLNEYAVKWEDNWGGEHHFSPRFSSGGLQAFGREAPRLPIVSSHDKYSNVAVLSGCARLARVLHPLSLQIHPRGDTGVPLLDFEKMPS